MKVVFSFLGRLIALFSVTLLVPCFAAYLLEEDLTPYIYTMFISMFLGIFFYISSRGEKSHRFVKSFPYLYDFSDFDTIKPKEAFTFVSISWLFIAFISSIPYIFNGVNPIDAFFEAMSGLTTTGASVLIPEELPRSLLLWRSFTQWLGGIGVIVLFLIIFPSLTRRTAMIFKAEYPGITLDRLKPRIRDTALAIFLLYLFLTILEILILRFLGLDLFDSIVHTFSNISTGGFSTHSESIAYFNNVLVEVTIILFMIVGGTNFGLLYFAFKSNMKILRNSEFRFYIFLLFSASLILTIINSRNFDFLDSLRYSTFQAVSMMTGTGFTTYDFDTWTDPAKFILLVLMFIGGCSGSTTGGIKVIRILLLIKYSIWRILRAAEPRTLRIVKYNDFAVSEDVLEDVAAFFTLYIFLFLISSFIITISGYDLLTSLSASAATLSNVGPGMGLFGASETYASLAAHLKLLLCLNMWIGRLEIFAVLILFTPFYWKEGW